MAFAVNPKPRAKLHGFGEVPRSTRGRGGRHREHEARRHAAQCADHLAPVFVAQNTEDDGDRHRRRHRGQRLHEDFNARRIMRDVENELADVLEPPGDVDTMQRLRGILEARFQRRAGGVEHHEREREVCRLVATGKRRVQSRALPLPLELAGRSTVVNDHRRQLNFVRDNSNARCTGSARPLGEEIANARVALADHRRACGLEDSRLLSGDLLEGGSEILGVVEAD
jgi:hypothetical protein